MALERTYPRGAVAVDRLTASRVIRNTYTLLGMLFVASAATSALAVAQSWHMPFWWFIAGIFGFGIALGKTRNSAAGVAVAFGFAAFLGVVTGGNIDLALARWQNAGALVTASFTLTATIFFGLSAYAMVAKRDYSGWIAMLVPATLVVIGAFILNYFLALPALALAVSSAAILLSCGWIVWQTQQLVRNGATNYILAATNLLADIFVLFNNLLALLGFGFGDD